MSTKQKLGHKLAMPLLNATIESETARLEQFQTSRVIGICYLDRQGRLIQLFDFDEQLREAIVEYQQERIRQLVRSERAAERVDKLLAYPVRQD